MPCLLSPSTVDMGTSQVWSPPTHKNHGFGNSGNAIGLLLAVGNLERHVDKSTVVSDISLKQILMTEFFDLTASSIRGQKLFLQQTSASFLLELRTNCSTLSTTGRCGKEHGPCWLEGQLAGLENAGRHGSFLSHLKRDTPLERLLLSRSEREPPEPTSSLMGDPGIGGRSSIETISTDKCF
jgi:hypothetical protein